MLPCDYRVRLMQPADYVRIGEICRVVYPHETPYTPAELAEHHAVFPQGQFVAEHVPTGEAVGVHFTLRLRMADYHIDDSWDVLTARGTFGDHDPRGPTLYGADVFVSPEHQHPVLSAHLKDGWSVVRPIHGYLQHDPESANWAAVIQWVNPACPPPPEMALR